MQTEKKTSGPTGALAPSGRPDLADSARQAARREMEEARERLSAAARRARRDARQARSGLSRLVMDEVDRRKGDLCDSLHGLACSMRRGAEEAARREDAPPPPRLVHQAIDTMEEVARRMRHRSTEDITGAVSRFGRENPAAFVTGALLAGVAIGRFLASSSSGSPGPGSADDDRADADRGIGGGRRDLPPTDLSPAGGAPDRGVPDGTAGPDPSGRSGGPLDAADKSREAGDGHA